MKSKNKTTVFSIIGASNHSKTKRQKEDYYATEPKATKLLLQYEKFSNVLEPACGEGHISKVLEENGINVTSEDLYYRGYGEGGKDFIFRTENWNGDIITNPPYKIAQDFIEKSLSIIPTGRKVAMFLKLTFLEGKRRKELFRNDPPKRILVSSSRLICSKNGDFHKYNSSAICYAWYIWEKGYKGKTIIDWIN